MIVRPLYNYEKIWFFFKKKTGAHLTTGKRVKIVDIAKIIKKLLLQRKLKYR